MVLRDTESALIAAIDQPTVRRLRLRALRRDRRIGRIVFAASAVALLIITVVAPDFLRLLPPAFLLVTGLLWFLRAEAQINLLLAVDRMQEWPNQTAGGREGAVTARATSGSPLPPAADD